VEQYASAEFSQFLNWSEIAAKAEILFKAAAKPSNDLLAVSKRFEGNGWTPELRAIAILKFVQEEIRYTGIEEGRGAFRPTAPTEVLKHRYGDCKDKTLLAVTLLRQAGIDAVPALVSTRWRQKLGDRLPSPGLMNHAVVYAQIAGNPYWFDATVTGQAGQLAQFTQAHFGAALLVEPGVTQLEAMPDDAAVAPLTASHSTFDLRAGLQADAALTVATQYFGVEADIKRRQLRSTSAAELGKRYLEYYKGRYPGTYGVSPPLVTDDLERNELTIVESYRIGHIFKTNKRKKAVLHLFADTITGSLDAPDPPERKMPLALDFPTHDTEKITVLLPSAWQVTADAKTIRTPAFEYGSKFSYRNNEVTLEYRFHILADSVPANQLPQYVKQLSRAKDDVYFDLSYDPGATVTANATGDVTALKLAVLLAGGYLAFLALRYVLVMRQLLSMTVQHVDASACEAGQMPACETRLLMTLDGPLIEAGFQSMGFLAHASFVANHDKPEHIRVFAHPGLPITAFVSRHSMPEFGDYVNLSLETPLADGQTLHTTNQPAGEPLADAKMRSERLPGVSVQKLIARHQQRLETIAEQDIRPISPGLSSRAAELTIGFAAVRGRMRSRGWLAATTDPLLDTFTLRGAFLFARASIRRHEGRGARHLSQSAWPDKDKELRAEADFLALWHLSRSPKTAAGIQWSTLTLGFGLAAALSVAAFSVVGAQSCLLLLAAIATHEIGHVMAIKADGKLAAPLFLLPFFGVMGAGNAVNVSLAERTAQLLAGPLAGLIVAELLLLCNVFWPISHLSAAAWVLIFVNGITLTPLIPFDGARILSGLTRPGTASTLLIQIGGVGALIVMGMEFNSTGLICIGAGWVYLLVRSMRAYRFSRTVTASIAEAATWEDVARKALILTTTGEFIRWSGAKRRALAAELAERFTAPPATRQERTLAACAYALSAALFIFVAYAVRRH
jgi:hypothetical protein